MTMKLVVNVKKVVAHSTVHQFLLLLTDSGVYGICSTTMIERKLRKGII